MFEVGTVRRYDRVCRKVQGNLGLGVWLGTGVRWSPRHSLALNKKPRGFRGYVRTRRAKTLPDRVQGCPDTKHESGEGQNICPPLFIRGRSRNLCRAVARRGITARSAHSGLFALFIENQDNADLFTLYLRAIRTSLLSVDWPFATSTAWSSFSVLEAGMVRFRPSMPSEIRARKRRSPTLRKIIVGCAAV
jgi:hypothetical protein